ncbi:hypothetical protein CERSUDRAFT_92287 [Gelatoporia subvermispora B]|uniref:DUF6535 domain-containing protein n=1 Tax=Ceriporiopsis subvermispora (strain B) TaxID=914234 RepID=M2PSY2_CERS8|nr:hypothetical protein CERSUDRAFT_92287 [Gelatoporia subvermispora B]
MSDDSKRAEAAWAECAKAARDHDEEQAKTWKEEIDPLLVFAGLLSGVLTAFIAIVWTQLTPAFDSPDINTAILLRISAQLEARNNATSPADILAALQSMSPGAGQPSSAWTWIGCLWFASLILSLSASSISLNVRQWLNHFTSPTPQDPVCSTYIHCLRWYMGFVNWHVAGTLSVLPLLLQMALILFLIGVVILTWTALGVSVAAITTPLVAILLSFLTFTTLAPIFKKTCPYKSPQALFACWVCGWLYPHSRPLLKLSVKVLRCITRRTRSSLAKTVLIFLEKQPKEFRKPYGTWIALEEEFLDDFVDTVTMRYLQNTNDHEGSSFHPDSLTLRRFQCITTRMRQPQSYVGQEAAGKIMLDLADQIPDHLICEFAITCRSWIVNNMPLTGDYIMKFVKLSARCFHAPAPRVSDTCPDFLARQVAEPAAYAAGPGHHVRAGRMDPMPISGRVLRYAEDVALEEVVVPHPDASAQRENFAPSTEDQVIDPRTVPLTLFPLVVRRHTLLMTLLTDAWHAGNMNDPPVDHEFIDFIMTFACEQMGQLSASSDLSEDQVFATAHACNLSLQLAGLLPIASLAYLDKTLHRLSAIFENRRLFQVYVDSETLTDPARKYLSDLKKLIKGYDAIEEIDGETGREMRRKVEEMERTTTGCRARARAMAEILSEPSSYH